MKKTYFSLILVCICMFGIKAIAQTTFNYTGSQQTYAVPAGCSSVAIDIAGAQGGASNTGSPGGKGGRVQAVLAVTSGQVLYIYVGGAGPNSSNHFFSGIFFTFGGGR